MGNSFSTGWDGLAIGGNVRTKLGGQLQKCRKELQLIAGIDKLCLCVRYGVSYQCKSPAG